MYARQFLILCIFTVDQLAKPSEIAFCSYSRKTKQILSITALNCMMVQVQVQCFNHKNEQSLSKYTHYWSHILNLAISFACKNQSIQKFIHNLTSVSCFFEDSPKL